MTRNRYRAPRRSFRMSRRRVLALAATGAGISAASVAGLSLAGERGGTGTGQGSSLVVSLRDAGKGTIDIFAGESVRTVTDRKLAAALLEAAGR